MDQKSYSWISDFVFTQEALYTDVRHIVKKSF
jgi:hypothetical protein